MTLSIVASIYEGEENGLDFDSIQDSYIRILDLDSRNEIFRSDFREFPISHTILIGSVTRVGNGWKFQSTMSDFREGVSEVARLFGVEMNEGCEDKKIVLLCSWGMSISILVKNMQEAADREGFDCIVSGHATSEASRVARDADCILLAPQIRFQREEIARQCPGVPIDSIDMKVYGKADGKGALAIAKRLMGV